MEGHVLLRGDHDPLVRLHLALRVPPPPRPVRNLEHEFCTNNFVDIAEDASPEELERVPKLSEDVLLGFDVRRTEVFLDSRQRQVDLAHQTGISAPSTAPPAGSTALVGVDVP